MRNNKLQFNGGNQLRLVEVFGKNSGFKTNTTRQLAALVGRAIFFLLTTINFCNSFATQRGAHSSVVVKFLCAVPKNRLAKVYGIEERGKRLRNLILYENFYVEHNGKWNLCKILVLNYFLRYLKNIWNSLENETIWF